MFFGFPYFSIKSAVGGLQPALRGLGLHRVVVEWVLRPKILLPEPHDVILFESAIPIESFVFGDEILICASGDRAHDTADIHLGAGVEQVRQVLDANTVAHLETGFASGILRFFQRLTFWHSEISPLQSSRPIRSARCGFCRPAFAPRPKSSVRSMGCQDRAHSPNRYRLDGVSPRSSICPSSRQPHSSSSGAHEAPAVRRRSALAADEGHFVLALLYISFSLSQRQSTRIPVLIPRSQRPISP